MGVAVSGVVAGGVGFLVAGAFVPLLVRFAVGRNLLDVPNLRSSHEAPTPWLGGVAMFPEPLAGAGLLSRAFPERCRRPPAWVSGLRASGAGWVHRADSV